MSEENELYFHGADFSDGSWNSKNYTCCKLCKTKNSRLRKSRHWSQGLCRSCYRRLNLNHRLYNDRKDSTADSPKQKKDYKLLDNPLSITFDELDIETLLDRYNWSCAYSQTRLQAYNHKRRNAFQLEYLILGGRAHIVPICRACNCSKKNIVSEEGLQKWCASKNLPYPPRIITLEDYLNS